MSDLSRNTSPNLEGEQWRQVDVAPDYEISNMGRLRVMVDKVNGNGRNFYIGKIITQSSLSKTKKYLRASVSVDGKLFPLSIHRAVAIAFIANPNNYPQVNHIDGNPANNLVENLEWVTPTENAIHARDNGLLHPRKGEDSSSSKLTEKDVVEILEHRFIRLLRYKDISKMFPDRHPQYIALICQGKRWRHVFEQWVKSNTELYARAVQVLSPKKVVNP